MGGNEALIKRLNQSLEMAETHGFVNPSEQDRDKYINYGNQPSMQTGHIFTHVGAPWLTQYWVRKVIEEVYSGNDPQSGYSGDEDQGLMGALAVLMKIGLFSMQGGANPDPIYEISSPIFDSITLHLDDRYYPGKKFVIQTANNDGKNLYIQQAIFNGEPLSKAWVLHRELIKGGTLELELGPVPNKDWGSDPNDFPPSLSY